MNTSDFQKAWEDSFKSYGSAWHSFSQGGFTSTGSSWPKIVFADEPRKPTPELQALCGGFCSAMGAEDWKLQVQTYQTGAVRATWRKGSEDFLATFPAAERPIVFANICRALARHLGLTGFEKGFVSLLA